LAINDQNWSKAKSYYVYGSDAYYKVCYIEDEFNTLHLAEDLAKNVNREKHKKFLKKNYVNLIK